MLLLKQDIIQKKQVNNSNTTIRLYLDKSNSKEYEIKTICDNDICTKRSDNNYHLPGIYYLVLWKEYLKEKNTWELALDIQYFWRFVITFHKKHFEKLTAIFLLIDFALLIAKPIVKLRNRVIKQKYNQPIKANTTNKYTKKTKTINFILLLALF